MNNLDSIGGCLRRLSVSILRRSLQPLRLALELAFYVACSSSDCFFNLTAKVFGIPHNAIFIHSRTPNEISGPQLLEWKLGSLRGQKSASGESLRYQIRKA